LAALDFPKKHSFLTEELLEGEFFAESGSFQDRYTKIRKSLIKKLDSFSEDQSEKNTHDVRTAIRRMNAALELFPAKDRKSSKVNRLRKKLDRVMDESAEVRDLDVILRRLSRHPQSETRKDLLRKIEKNRKKQSERAAKAAGSASKITLPKGRDLSVEKIRKRFTRRVEDLSFRIDSSLPKILEDPSNVEEIHLVRKYCKRVRYLFELAGDSQTGETLKSWQDVLGSIHDGDVTIAYLIKKLKKSTAPGESKEMIATEVRDRDHDYEKFLQLYRKS
jgi:CHAD domain-containing protein